MPNIAGGLAEWGDILRIVPVAISLGINLWALRTFLSRSFRAKRFFAGRWHGDLITDGGYLKCTAVFYEEKGALSGHIYYEGEYANKVNVRGFDRLSNDTRHFVCKRRRFFVAKAFQVLCHRTVHTFALENNGETHIFTKTEPYTYEMTIQKRFGNPRLRCEVATQPLDEDDQGHTFAGELAKA